MIPAKSSAPIKQSISTAAPPPEGSSSSKAVRDAYIAARFPGTVYCGDDLAETERVIRAARLYFDESQKAKAAELLDLAIALHPAREEPWLARLELAFLARNPPDFRGVAHAFRHFHPGSGAWKEVARLGIALMPAEAMFGTASQGDASRYGPWPDTPNWIQASWDLTAEVRAAEFHNAMRRRAAAAAVAPLARAA
jgi:hypothetical protein